MAAIVHIDQPITEVAVQAGAGQSVGFDVVNIAGRSLHLVASPVPAHGARGAPPDWIALDGERTFRLAPSETRKITCRLTPPPTAPAGTTGFRLKVYEVSLPEENNGFSEPVQVAVTATPPPAPNRPWKPIAAMAAALVLVVAVGGWLAYAWLGAAAMPDVEGQTLEAANAALAAAGVPPTAVTVAARFVRDADGKVTRQEPAAGTPITADTVVTLTAPRQPVMPAVDGESQARALSLLAQAGIPRAEVAIEQPLDRAADGSVSGQAPAAGTPIGPTTAVALTVPRQPRTLTLPRLAADATGEAALRSFRAVGLQVDLVEDRNAPGREPGRVIQVLPQPGSAVLETATIEVRVQSTTVNVPRFTGRVITPDERARLDRYFVVNQTPMPMPGVPMNCVFQQSHDGEVRRGTTITLTTTLFIPLPGINNLPCPR